jgi:hypothetical protein
MKLVTTGVLLAVLLGNPARGDDKDPSKGGAEYFPVHENSVWTYKAQGKTFTTRVVSVEKAEDEVRVKLETRRDKDLVATETYGVSKEGVFRRRFADKDIKPPLQLLRFPLKANDSWPFDSKVADQDTKGSFKVEEAKGIKVPAGSYDTYSVTSKNLTIDSQPVVVTYYFAKGVGLVKQVVDIGGSKTELELEKYEEGKK